MKQLHFILMLLLSGVILGQGKKNQVIITGKISGRIPNTIEYTVPLESICYFGFEKTIKPDSLGNFKIILSINKPSFIELSNAYQAYGTIIAEPGMNYSVSINTELKDKIFSIKSKNAAAQALYNQIDNRSMITGGGHFEMDSRKYIKDSIPSEIKKKIENSREIELTPFRELLNKKLISKDFFNLVYTDRDYFYKGIQGSVAFVNYLKNEQKQNTLTKDQYSQLWKDIFQSNPVTNPELLHSPWFYYYVENYLRYHEFIIDSIDVATLTELNKQGKIHTHKINYAKKHLSGQQLEYYTAAYIYYTAINKNYEKELLSLFADFKKNYPSSNYTSFIEPLMLPIVDFHKKEAQTKNDKIKFIDDSTAISTLKEVVTKLDSKLIYVDVWATWCGPCKEEFKFNNGLYEFLKTKNIPIVYLSIDKNEKEKQWRDMINYYNLEGYHIRANEKLIADLQKIVGNDSFAIPWHILIDGNGNIVKKNVSGPSKLENLKQELN